MNSKVMEEYQLLIQEAARRYRNGEYAITDIKNKERFLQLAFKYKQGIFAHQIGIAINIPIDKMVWLAVEHCCNDILEFLLKDTSKLDLSIKDNYKNNLLHRAAWGDVKIIKIIIDNLKPETIRKYVNEPNEIGDTPLHTVIRRSPEFDECVQWFAEFGGDFKLKNKQGISPAQDSSTLSPTRLKLLQQVGVTNLKTLRRAIVTNDLDAVKENISETSRSQLQAIFEPIQEEDKIKVPIHKDMGWGSMLHSTYRPYIQHSIYECHVELVQFLIGEVLIKENLTDTKVCLEIVTRHLNYTDDLIKHLSYGKNIEKYRAIRSYFAMIVQKLSLTLDTECTANNPMSSSCRSKSADY